jgi:transposase
MGECEEDGDDGGRGSECWPGGARPSRWRRRASSGWERLARPAANVGTTKQGAVLRLLRGEDLELVSRELGVTAAGLSAWRDAFLAAGEAALKTGPAHGRDVEIGRLKAKVGELTMANELLDAKIDHLETHRPLARRRSRR